MKKEGKLEEKILRVDPLRDNKGRYIPYCDFRFHQGICLKPYICEQRCCTHYQKLYIN